MEQKKCKKEGCENLIESTKGKREKEYCSDRCRIAAFLKKKYPSRFVQKDRYEKLLLENTELKQKIQDLTKPNKEVKPYEQPKTNYTIPPHPKREDYADAVDFGMAKSEWKKKYNL